MPSLEESVVEFAADRPYWQRIALRKIIRSELIDESEVERLAKIAIAETSGLSLDGSAISSDDLPEAVGGKPRVRLLSVSQPTGVNALNPNSSLTLQPEGLTIVYGDNASGKSGWARILKDVARARHHEPILPNVFSAEEPSAFALVAFVADTDEREHEWPSDDDSVLRQVSFYDSACGISYLTSETEVAYRPIPLAALDRLATLCSEVRSALDARNEMLEQAAITLPEVPDDTPQAALLAGLSKDTSHELLDELCSVPDGADALMSDLQKRQGELASSAPVRERERLESLSGLLPPFIEHLDGAGRRVSQEAISEIQRLCVASASLRRAADDAASSQFGDEPLAGVGSPTWRALWEAARGYSDNVAYPAETFPVLEIGGEPGLCVLCQQPLEEMARSRLATFADFVVGVTEQEALLASDAASAAIAEYLDLVVRTHESVEALVHLQAEDAELHAHVDAALASIEGRRKWVVRAAETGVWKDPPELFEIESEELSVLQGGLSARLSGLDDAGIESALVAVSGEIRDLASRRELAEVKEQLKAEIKRLGHVAIVEAAISLTTTHAITRKSVELTRRHVGEEMQGRFREEASALGLDQVRLVDVGGERGRLRHQAQLHEAVAETAPRLVLSEGEKTALGLAAFFTEVELDESKSGVVLDDPVSSMDHVREKQVASRLAVLATERQVVVFTHSVALVVDLKRAAGEAGVHVEGRWVFENDAGTGNTSDKHPWKAKLVPQKMDSMAPKLGELRRAHGSDPDIYDRLVREWYRDLRSIWERMIEETVVGHVLDRGELQIRPRHIPGLVSFNQTDADEIDAAFTKCGELGSHDQSQYLNRAAVQINDLEQDLEDARAWFDRVRRYF